MLCSLSLSLFLFLSLSISHSLSPSLFSGLPSEIIYLRQGAGQDFYYYYFVMVFKCLQWLNGTTLQSRARRNGNDLHKID